MAVSPIASTSGTTSGTTATVTLPTYVAGDAVILFVSRNQTEANPFTFSSSVSSATELSNVGTRRLTAILLTPNGLGQTSTTVTWATSAVFTWYVGVWRGYDLAATIAHAENAIGSTTASSVTAPTTLLPYIATGNELAISAVGLNATATWTGSADTVYTTGSAINGALEVAASRPTAGALTAAPLAVDRGLSGTSRNESALAFVIQADPLGTPNLLTNGSFETFTSGVATGWADEHTTATQPGYTAVTSGVVDGGYAQQVQYTGVTADAGTAKFEIYQSPVNGVSPGDVLTFSVYLSGSLTSAYGFIGIEGFTTGGTYLSESDTNFTTLTGTPTQYTATYTCPATTTYVAVYMQVPSLNAGVAATVVLDKATLTKSTATNATVTGSLATGAAVAPAGAVSTSVAVAGPLAQVSAVAPAGQVTATRTATITGLVAAAQAQALAGLVAVGSSATVPGALATVTALAPAGTVAAGGPLRDITVTVGAPAARGVQFGPLSSFTGGLQPRDGLTPSNGLYPSEPRYALAAGPPAIRTLTGHLETT